MREIERAKSMHDVVDEVLPKVTHACTAAHIHIHTRTTHAHTLPNSTLNIALGLQLWTTHTHTLTYMHTLTMTRRRNNAQARVIEITVRSDKGQSCYKVSPEHTTVGQIKQLVLGSSYSSIRFLIVFILQELLYIRNEPYISAKEPSTPANDGSSPHNVERTSWRGQLFVRIEGKTRVLHNVASHYSVPL